MNDETCLVVPQETGEGQIELVKQHCGEFLVCRQCKVGSKPGQTPVGREMESMARRVAIRLKEADI